MTDTRPAGEPDPEDPVARSIRIALCTALDHDATDAIAEPLATALTARLAVCAPPSPSRSSSPSARTAGQLSAATLTHLVTYIDAHLDRSISLEELARQAHLSKYHFLRSFAATVGTTPHRYLTARRMHRAADLLRSTQAPVAVVAARCGYASTSRFSAVFREHHGTTPSCYRLQGP